MQIIHNPGVIPDSRLNDPVTDITIVFEETYENYGKQKAALKALPLERFHYGYLVHSVPTTLNSTDLGVFVDELSKDAGSIFLTNRDTDYYQAFGSSWKTFIDVMPT